MTTEAGYAASAHRKPTDIFGGDLTKYGRQKNQQSPICNFKTYFQNGALRPIRSGRQASQFPKSALFTANKTLFNNANNK
jgi:hypothetical protein